MVEGCPTPSDSPVDTGQFRAPKYRSECVVSLADCLIHLLAENVVAHDTTAKIAGFFAGEGDDPPHLNTVGYWWRRTPRDAPRGRQAP